MTWTVKAVAKRLVALALAVCALLALAIVLLVLVAHFNPLTGTYSYDPRNEQPNSFFLQNRPEETLTQQLKVQIAKEGSYPPGAQNPVKAIEPVKVDVATYSDWATEARITTQLEYANGTRSIEVFRFRDASSEGMWMPIVPGGEMSIRARFGNLADCKPEQPGRSYCDINLHASQ